jgi:hypothetical protein
MNLTYANPYHMFDPKLDATEDEVRADAIAEEDAARPAEEVIAEMHGRPL